jgi:hypothetical protein
MFTMFSRRREANKASPNALGSGEEIDARAAKARLAALGDDGQAGVRLEHESGERLRSLGGLSPLSVPLALSYLDRIARPLAAMDLESAVKLTSRGYAAHLVIEANGRDFGVDTLPVLGGLPPFKHGRPPQQLLSIVVKATRRSFPGLRGVSEPTWDGLVISVARRVHAARVRDADGVLPLPLDVAVIDALLRFGWVLRQVDLYYGFEPERNTP